MIIQTIIKQYESQIFDHSRIVGIGSCAGQYGSPVPYISSSPSPFSPSDHLFIHPAPFHQYDTGFFNRDVGGHITRRSETDILAKAQVAGGREYMVGQNNRKEG